MLYNLKNDYLTIDIDSLGGELQSIKDNNDYQYLWQGDSKYWGRRAPVLFPIVGSIANNKYTYKGLEYEMTQHGFARDMEFNLIEKEENKISLELKSNDKTKLNYPFDFKFIMSYELIKNKLNISYKIINLGDVLYYNIGAHPAFNIENVNDYSIDFDNIDMQIDIWNKEYVYNQFNGTKIELNEDSFKDDAIIFTKTSSAVLKENNNNILRINYEDFDLMGIWGKEGKTPFVCLEPWSGLADPKASENCNLENKLYISKLDKEESKEFTYSIDFLKEGSL